MKHKSRLGVDMSHGGVRMGAGRPRGRGKYGEETKSVRIPASRITDVMRFINNESSSYKVPLYGGTVRAGFPSPADDYIETMLDLNEYLIKHPAATFFVRASGDSMINAGIHSGDILVVDRSLEAVHGKIVIAALNGELTVKRLVQNKGQLQLAAENPNFPPITITEEFDMVIWGVVTHVIHTAA
jgi:DNA polymerase V